MRRKRGYQRRTIIVIVIFEVGVVSKGEEKKKKDKRERPLDFGRRKRLMTKRTSG